MCRISVKVLRDDRDVGCLVVVIGAMYYDSPVLGWCSYMYFWPQGMKRYTE